MSRAVMGPTLCSRPRTRSVIASSRCQIFSAFSAGGSTCGSRRPSGYTDWTSGRHSAHTQKTCDAVCRRVARRASMSSSRCRVQPALAPSCSVITPMACMASCSSSAFVTSGHACSRTAAMAAGSSLPMSAALSGSSQRRCETASVRRSSRGASSRIGVGPRGEDFRGERRRLDQILGDDLDGAGLEADQQIAQAIDVHGVVQAVRAASASRAGDRESRAAPTDFPRRRSGRETAPRSDPRTPCAGSAAACACRRSCGGWRARCSRSSASAR